MLRIAIYSPEETAIQTEKFLINYAEENNLTFLVHCFSNPIYLLEMMDMDFQIFFLDLEVPLVKKKKLIQSIRKIDKYAYLIFLIPARDGFIFETYSVQVVDYLIKPITQNSLYKEMNKALHYMKKMRNEYILIKNHSGCHKIYLSDVYYIETFERNLLIHTNNGNLLCNKSMQQLEEELMNFPFIRCHSGYIVNLEYIKKIIQNVIELECHERILVSKWRRKEVIDRLVDYVESV
ncbi:hypothetical protein BSK64_13390 [Paenibacillus odorifer]|uniref:LytR/AlgR family response regulator transcription factor n=1 Tax=Paenibacillus odorifer TaxID=189426 RepID=UPI00096C2343|nr:LytTR family DNA-binding domain-containing protein [Paenibacillus odorifer]OME05868.1 hypothetical protein BSK64_13390 [Paenibacillus odorifer]